MAKFTLKGFNHRVGTYKENAYDNYQLFGINERNEWEFIPRVKAKIISDAGIKDLNAIVGNDLEVLYDRYGNIVTLRMG